MNKYQDPNMIIQDIPVFSVVLEFLVLKDLEVLARCSSSLFHIVLHDRKYHLQIKKILSCLEKQWRYLEERNSTDRPIEERIVKEVEKKYKNLQSFYDSFSFQGYEMISTQRKKIIPIFPYSL